MKRIKQWVAGFLIFSPLLAVVIGVNLFPEELSYYCQKYPLTIVAIWIGASTWGSMWIID